jgi:two-component system, OmpR family, phosphate regulon response regulator PhoB
MPEEEKKSFTIVIVDDEESIRTLVQATLEAPDCRVLQAANGHEALHMARRERPQAIILDWMMPSMSGLELLHQLAEDPLVSGIPVVMLTAMGQEKDRDAAMKAGAKAFLMKPFSPLQLVGIVREAVNSSQCTCDDRPESRNSAGA